MDEEEAVLPSSSATSVRKKREQSKQRPAKEEEKKTLGSLLQTQTGRKRSMTEKYINYGFSLCSSLEVFRVRCFFITISNSFTSL